MVGNNMALSFQNKIRPVATTSNLSFASKIRPVQQTTVIKESPSQKAARLLDMFFGGGKIGEAIGTQIAKAQASPEERQFIGEGPTKGQIFGSALQAGALFAPVGKIASGLTAGARALGIAKGASAIGKIGSGALTGGAFDVATNLQEGKTGADVLTPGLGTTIGGAIPGIGVAKNVTVRFGEQQAPRVINSLIKPLAKDFSYGKNPGRAIAEEGIIANNFDDLLTKIRSTRQKIGQAIGELGNKLSTKPELNIKESLLPINEAMKDAASMNNPTLLSRLVNVKQAITSILEPAVDDSGNIIIKKVGDRKLEGLTFSEVRDILSDIGDMTQFTGNPSDDKLVNSALKQVYGSIKEKSLEGARNVNPELASEFEKLTEKYADLSSAEIATKYRDKIVERSNLIGLSPQIAGIGAGLITMIATGGASTPAVLAGLTGAVVDKLASTPGFKTRLAALLSKKTTQEANVIFKKFPVLRRMFPKGSAISPGDRLLETKPGQKLEQGIKDYAKNPKLGMSIEDISKSKIDDNLLKEARKYKSAEEFVKAQGTPFYHGSKNEIKVFGGIPDSGTRFLGRGTYFTDNANRAKEFGNINEAVVNLKNPYRQGEEFNDILKAEIRKLYGKKEASIAERIIQRKEPLKATEINSDLITKLYQKAGYDGVISTGGIFGAGRGDILVFNPSQIKTKSQLIDIWKKANKKK